MGSVEKVRPHKGRKYIIKKEVMVECPMNQIVEFIADITDQEFDGASFNGPSLIKTLSAVSIEAISARDTHEGYSVADVVMHLMHWKRSLTQLIGGKPAPDPYAFEDADWTDLGVADLTLWNSVLEAMKAAHIGYIRALRSLSDEDIKREIPEWKCTIRQACTWMATHDCSHVAQIRNMGVQGLSSPRE